MERRFLLEEDFQFVWDRLINKRVIDETAQQEELMDFVDREFAARMKMVADYQQWLAKQE